MVRLPLMVVGVSHDTAPVDVRERLAYAPAEASQALNDLRGESGVSEAVLLSTCNRTEIYIYPAGGQEAAESVRRILTRKAPDLADRLEGYIFETAGEDAVRHLFRVCSGLDSMVTGEAEIQGQVKEAYQRSSGLGGAPPIAGPVLNRLFQTALSVGGRVRSETSIGQGSASVASVAVELASKIFGSLRGKRVLILGAGMTGELIVEALTREGVEEVFVANRTYDRAIDLARKHRGHALPFDRIRETLPTVDIVLSSTAAPHPVLTRSIVRESFDSPREHPLLIIDVAVPRDVDPAVGDEPEVFLYNVDDLRKIVDEHVRLREDALPAADLLIEEGWDDFRTWFASLEVVPVIREIRRQADELRERELGRLLARLPDIDEDYRMRLEEFSRRLQNKLLHEPTVRLRRGFGEGASPELIDAVRFLYGIETVPDLRDQRESEGVDPSENDNQPQDRRTSDE